MRWRSCMLRRQRICAKKSLFGRLSTYMLPVVVDHWRICRSSQSTTEQLHQTGEDLFTSTYGEKADDVRALLYDIYPDLGPSLLTP